MAGLGSFIEGAMQGYQFGTAAQDRKRRQKIEDEKLDAWREDREWTKSERERKRAAQQAQRARAEAERQRMADINNEARVGFENQKAPNPGRSIIIEQDPNSEVPSGDINTAQPQTPQQEAPPRRPRSINMAPEGVGQPQAPQEPPARRPRDMNPPPQAGQAPGGMPQPQERPAQPQIDSTTPQSPPQPRRRGVTPVAPAASGGGAPDGARDDMPMPASFAQNPSVLEAAQSANMEPGDLWSAMAPDWRRKYLAEDNPQGRQTQQQPAQPAAPSRPDMPSTPPERGVLARGAAGRNDPAPQDRSAPTMPQPAAGGTQQPGGPSRTAPSEVVDGAQADGGRQNAGARSAPSITSVDENASAFMQDVQSYRRQGEIGAASRKIATRLATGGYDAPASSPAARTVGNAIDYFTKTPQENEQADAERAKSKATMKWLKSPEAARLFKKNPDLLEEAAADPVAFHQRIMEEGANADAQAEPGAAPDPGNDPSADTDNGSGQPLPSTPQAPTSPGSVQPTAGQRPPVSPEDPPSVQAAAATAPDPAKSKPKPGPGRKYTPAQKKRASDNFIEYWAKNAAPKLRDDMLRRGEIEKAMAFEEFSQTVQSKSQLRSWSEAAFSFSVGDFNGAVDSLADLYSKLDDGFDLVREKTGPVIGDNGDALGAQMTFRDNETGEEFTRDFKDMNDLVETGLYALQPDKTYEEMFNMYQKAMELTANSKQGITTKQLILETSRLRKQNTDAVFGGGEELNDDQLMRQAYRNLVNANRYVSGGAQGAGSGQPPPDNYTE